MSSIKSIDAVVPEAWVVIPEVTLKDTAIKVCGIPGIPCRSPNVVAAIVEPALNLCDRQYSDKSIVASRLTSYL